MKLSLDILIGSEMEIMGVIYCNVLHLTWQTQVSICFMVLFLRFTKLSKSICLHHLCSFSAVSPHSSNLIQRPVTELKNIFAMLFTKTLTYLCHKYQPINNLRSARSTRPSLKLTTCGNEERAGQIQLKTQQILRRAQTFLAAALHLKHIACKAQVQLIC